MQIRPLFTARHVIRRCIILAKLNASLNKEEHVSTHRNNVWQGGWPGSGPVPTPPPVDLNDDFQCNLPLCHGHILAVLTSILKLGTSYSSKGWDSPQYCMLALPTLWSIACSLRLTIDKVIVKNFCIIPWPLWRQMDTAYLSCEIRAEGAVSRRAMNTEGGLESIYLNHWFPIFCFLAG